LGTRSLIRLRSGDTESRGATRARNGRSTPPFAAECVRAQSFSDFEWLVLDDSPQPVPMFDAIGDARGREPRSRTRSL
jgi:hypothetical protein